MRCRVSWCLLFGWLGFASGSGADAEGIPEPSAEAVLATVPFEPGPATRVMLNLAPPGKKPLVLMLDTGASDSVVTPRMARELGVTVRPAKTTRYRRSTRLGRDLQFWVDTSTSDSASKTGWEYGLLGGEFLDDYVLELDYPGRQVRFLDSKRYALPESTEAENERILRVKRSGTRVFTEIEIDGKQTWVLLDTGAPDSFTLSGKAARTVGIDVTSLPSWGRVGGVLGTTEALFLEAGEVRWAGFAFQRVPMLILPKGFYNQGGNTDSTVGYDLLHQFTIRIDYRRKRLWLRRGTDTRMTFFGADYLLSKQLGAQVSQLGPEAFQVWAIQPGGPAEAFGLQNDDVVVEPVDAAGPLTPEDVARRVLAREELTVARRDGDVWVDLVLPETASNEEGARPPSPE